MSLSRSDIATSDGQDSDREDTISQERNGFSGIGVASSF